MTLVGGGGGGGGWWKMNFSPLGLTPSPPPPHQKKKEKNYIEHNLIFLFN